MRFERMTCCLGGNRSILLSYEDTWISTVAIWAKEVTYLPHLAYM